MKYKSTSACIKSIIPWLKRICVVLFQSTLAFIYNTRKLYNNKNYIPQKQSLKKIIQLYNKIFIKNNLAFDKYI